MRNIHIIVLWICVVEVMESLSLRDPVIENWTENGDIETEEIKRHIEVGFSSEIHSFFNNNCSFVTTYMYLMKVLTHFIVLIHYSYATQVKGMFELMNLQRTINAQF